MVLILNFVSLQCLLRLPERDCPWGIHTQAGRANGQASHSGESAQDRLSDVYRCRDKEEAYGQSTTTLEKLDKRACAVLRLLQLFCQFEIISK